MFDPGPVGRERTALGRPRCCGGDDCVPSGNRGVHRGPAFGKMKSKRLIGAAVAAVVVLGAVYLWGPGAAPSGQEPLLTLSQSNVEDFEKAFDGEAGVPRLVLLLSPT